MSESVDTKSTDDQAVPKSAVQTVSETEATAWDRAASAGRSGTNSDPGVTTHWQHATLFRTRKINIPTGLFLHFTRVVQW